MSTPEQKNTRSPPTISPPLGTQSESFPYCVKAGLLLEELSRSDWLPVYNEATIRAIGEECEALAVVYLDIVAAYPDDHKVNPSVRTTLQVLQESIYRNKRCVLVYLNYRIGKIEELWWKTGSSSLAPEFSAKLSSAEIEYYSKFRNLLEKTMDAVDFDLSSHVQPPHDLLIEVRALKDAGELLLQSGARVLLEKNSTHFLRRTDVEHLIRQNYLEQLQ